MINMTNKPRILIISCEHAVNTVPCEYQHLFKHDQHVLQTHRAIDFGASEIASYLALSLHAACVQATVTRLLIDCNRSLNHPSCLSEWSQSLASTEKETLITQYYHPFRHQLIHLLEACINRGQPVFHLSVHSFTPMLHGITRTNDIGLLYDPSRHPEKQWAYHWKKRLHQTSSYRVQMNTPYRGTSDGFTRTLRQKYTETDYLGLELEINQALMTSVTSRAHLAHTLEQSLTIIPLTPRN